MALTEQIFREKPTSLKRYIARMLHLEVQERLAHLKIDKCIKVPAM